MGWLAGWLAALVMGEEDEPVSGPVRVPEPVCRVEGGGEEEGSCCIHHVAIGRAAPACHSFGYGIWGRGWYR